MIMNSKPWTMKMCARALINYLVIFSICPYDLKSLHTLLDDLDVEHTSTLLVLQMSGLPSDCRILSKENPQIDATEILYPVGESVKALSTH